MRLFVALMESTGPGVYRVEALRVGHWDYEPLDGGLLVTEELLRDLEANFRAGATGYEVPLNREHDKDRPCGWVIGLQVDADGQRLYATFRVTDPETQRLVDEGSLRYCSSEINLAWFDPEAKRELRVFEGLALTNYPYLKRMEPIQRVNLSDRPAAPAHDADQEVPLSEKPAIAPRNPASAGIELSEAATVRLAEAQAQLAEERRARQAVEAQLNEQELALAAFQASAHETAKRLRLMEVTERLQAMARRGRLTPAVYSRTLAFARAALEGNTVIHLGARRALADGEPEPDKLDVVEAVLDILNQMPDQIASGLEPALAEDGRPDDEDEDDEAAILSEVDRLRKQNPSLSFSDAAVQASRTRALARGGRR